jgi:hypothetical protein
LATAPDAFPSSSPRVAEALVDCAQQRAAAELPDHVARLGSAERARAAATQAGDVYYQTVAEIVRRDRHHCGYDNGAADLLPELHDHTVRARQRVAAADRLVEQLTADPILTTGPPGASALLDTIRAGWELDRGAVAARRQAAPEATTPRHATHSHLYEHGAYQHDTSPART